MPSNRVVDDDLTFYTLPEVADMFTVKVDTVRHWIRDGRLSAQKYGKAYRITRQSILDMVEAAK